MLARLCRDIWFPSVCALSDEMLLFLPLFSLNVFVHLRALAMA